MKEHTMEMVHKDHMDQVDFETSYLRVGVKLADGTQDNRELSVALTDQEMRTLDHLIAEGIWGLEGFEGLRTLQRFCRKGAAWALHHPFKVAP
jgi:hypothetical protein